MFVEVAVFAALRELNHAGLGAWLTFALNLIVAVLRRDRLHNFHRGNLVIYAPVCDSLLYIVAC